MIKRVLVAIYLSLTTIWLASAVYSSDHIELNTSYFFVDEVPRVAADNLEAFEPYEQGNNFGFRSDPIWVQLTVPEGASREGASLSITPIHTDLIEVWAKGEEYQQVLRAGDTVVSPRSIVPNGYSVALSEEELLHPIFVKLQSKNVLQPYFQLAFAGERLLAQQFILSIFTAAILATILYVSWTLSALAVSPNFLLYAFLARLVAFVITISIHSGVWRFVTSGDQLLPQDFGHNLSALAYISIAQIFDFFLLRTIYRWKVLALFSVVVATSIGAKFFFFAVGDVSAALQINNLSALLTLTVGGLTLLFPRQIPIERTSLSMSRAAAACYFGIQALPLFVLIGLSFLEHSGYVEFIRFAFLAYAIIPGGFITVMLFRQQRAKAAYSADIERQAAELALIADLEQGKRHELRRLLETLAHEIKTPLATLRMAEAVGKIDADMLRRSTSTITEVLAQVDRVEKIEAGDVDYDLIELDLVKLVKGVIVDLGLDVEIDYNRIEVRSDWNALYIILVNLLGNAAKYKSPSSPIKVSFVEMDQSCSVIIENSITSALRYPEKLFEKYYRDPIGHSQAGTGLGLYLSHALAQKINADVAIKTSDLMVSVELSISTDL